MPQAARGKETSLSDRMDQDRLFPTLTSAQIARIAPHGRRRAVARGDVLVEVGDANVPFFVVLSGHLQAVRPSEDGETLIVTHGAGQFSGEANMLTGRRAMGRLRVSESGEVLELTRDALLAVIQTDAEVSDILMRAFILRRAELIERHFGDVVLIGSAHCAGTLRVKEFLARNGHPYVYIDLDRDAAAQEMLDRFQVTAADVPVLICRGETVLRNPSNQRDRQLPGLQRCDRSDARPRHRRRRRWTGGSRGGGLRRVRRARRPGARRRTSPGGQAGSSSRIENYLGFPTGISGQELTARAYAQAQKFGARGADREGRHAARVRPAAVRGHDGRRRARAGARP